MKHYKFLGFIALGIAISTTAQVSVAVKANALLPSADGKWKNLSETLGTAYTEKGKNNIGYNIGLSAKIKISPSFFLMPEAYYTTSNSKFTEPLTNTTLEALSNRVDVPILVGTPLIGNYLEIVAGPVASYKLSKENKYNDFKEKAKSQFTVGYQFGAQIQVDKVLFNARYEGAFQQDQREYINTAIAKQSDYVIRYDNRQSLIWIGIGYQL
ncbi:outer membrane beta-barrel protein [Bergeyella sp. RCAD1439]|uniref:outer membrane beta-barrel protein n=1 Tax=Bergeyella anatis TaxID=3113737 RepID=UPI002E1712AB|nr:outer membrane beta-barrel protein [Bergeyella sp. RCAD1439]